jgi:hypothetical protein
MKEALLLGKRESMSQRINAFEKTLSESITTVSPQGTSNSTKLKNSLHGTTGGLTSNQTSGSMLMDVKPANKPKHIVRSRKTLSIPMKYPLAYRNTSPLISSENYWSLKNTM